MSKILKIALLGLGLSTIYSPTTLAKSNASAVLEEVEPVEEPKEEEPKEEEPKEEEPKEEEPKEEEPKEEEPKGLATVVIEEYHHGDVSADVLEGLAGDVCIITAKSDILYKISSVSVNEVVLIEDENTKGKFSFTLVEGENKIKVIFAVDEDVCKELTNIVQEAGDKDWTNLFTVENVVTIVKWILDGGILIALARYYIKDKKLENKVENSIQTTVANIIPESTKQAVLTTVEASINPFFENMINKNAELQDAMRIFSKCMALAQENTPESKSAIIDELSKIKISDQSTIDDVRKYLEESTEKLRQEFNDTINSLNKISEANKEILEEKVEEEKKEVF